MMQTVGERLTFGKDEDGAPYGPARLIRWLDAKYERHHEIEDKHAADMLRWFNQRTITDADRWNWLREQIKAKDTMVNAQALLWNHSSRKELDRAIDEQIRAERDSF